MEHVSTNPPMLERFWEQLYTSSRRVLMLDYDGTLAPFTTDRQQARPYPEVEQQLALLQRAGHTRLVIISGRRSSELKRLLPLAADLELFGSHGIEHSQPGSATAMMRIDPVAKYALDLIATQAVDNDLAAHLERKPGCLALHWRGEAEDRIQQLRDFAEDCWRKNIKGSQLDLREFDGGLEFRWQAATKAHAVKRVLAMELDAATAYLGDDQTDEDAFEALGEFGLSVLVREEPRHSAAQCWLRPPDELTAFLRHWLKADQIVQPQSKEKCQ